MAHTLFHSSSPPNCWLWPITAGNILLGFQLLRGPEGVQVSNHGLYLCFRKLVAQGRHFLSQTKFAIFDPVPDLLVRVMPGVFAVVQGGRRQLVSVPLGVLAVALGANSQINLAP